MSFVVADLQVGASAKPRKGTGGRSFSSDIRKNQKRGFSPWGTAFRPSHVAQLRQGTASAVPQPTQPHAAAAAEVDSSQRSSLTHTNPSYRTRLPHAGEARHPSLISTGPSLSFSSGSAATSPPRPFPSKLRHLPRSRNRRNISVVIARLTALPPWRWRANAYPALCATARTCFS
jgi:hypothetical protein